jgi:protein TonB
MLDAEALAMVSRAQPFPVPPSEVDDEKLKLVLPVIFDPRRPPTTIDTSKADAAIDKAEATVSAKMRSICRNC